MGNRILEENREERYDRILSNHLGLTYNEIGALEWTLDTNESKDGHIYSYLLKFSDDCPNNAIKKVNGIDDNNVVELGVGEYDTLFEQLK